MVRPIEAADFLSMTTGWAEERRSVMIITKQRLGSENVQCILTGKRQSKIGTVYPHVQYHGRYQRNKKCTECIVKLYKNLGFLRTREKY